MAVLLTTHGVAAVTAVSGNRRKVLTMTSPNKIGLAIAALMGGWHIIWSLLVLAGWAQPLIDFVFWAHMIRPIYVVQAFAPVVAFTLVAITAVIGYGFGYIGAVLWPKRISFSQRSDSA